MCCSHSGGCSCSGCFPLGVAVAITAAGGLSGLSNAVGMLAKSLVMVGTGFVNLVSMPFAGPVVCAPWPITPRSP